MENISHFCNQSTTPWNVPGAGLLEEKPVVHTGAILVKSIPNNDQVYERPMHQYKRSTEQNFLVSPEQQHQQSCEWHLSRLASD